MVGVAEKESETVDSVILEEVRLPPRTYPGLEELGKAILRIREARIHLLQIPEVPMHAHYDVFPGGQVLYCHPVGGCALCR